MTRRLEPNPIRTTRARRPTFGLVSLAASVAMLGGLFLPSAAAAYGVVRRDGGPAYCELRDLTCELGGPCPGVMECIAASGAQGLCIGPLEVVCVDGSEGCPDALIDVEVAGVRACVPGELELCPDRDTQCFENADGSGNIVRFPAGDCDSDGVANGLEEEGQICTAAPSLAVVEAESCRPLDVCAGTGRCDTGESCQPNDDAKHSYCLPETGAVAYCCTDATVCPNEEDCEVSDLDAVGLCGVEYCPELPLAERLSCFTSPSGVRVMNPDNGDCDGDGTSNYDERAASAGSECVEEDTGTPDGGTDGGPGDAGSEDAGLADAGAFDAAAADASGERDAGPERNVRFGGGGGCACRATPGSGSGAGLLLAVLVGGVFWLRRQGASASGT